MLEEVVDFRGGVGMMDDNATVSKTISTFGIRALGPSETVASSWGKLAHDSGTLKG